VDTFQVLYATDFPDVARSTRQRLNAYISSLKIHLISPARQALTWLDARPFHVLLLEPSSPKEALSLLQTLRRQFPALPVVILVESVSPPVVEAFLKTSAYDCLPRKEALPSRLAFLLKHAGHYAQLLRQQRELNAHLDAYRLQIEALRQQLSNLAHDLRTPLSSIRLHLTLLQRGKEERREDYLATLRREVERLESLVQSALESAQPDPSTPPVARQTCDINQVVQALARDRQEIARQRGLRFTWHLAPYLPPVTGNGPMIAQAIDNLIINALNYTPAGGEVAIYTMGHHLGEEKWITITVSDTGLGIAAEEIPHLFDRHYRGEAARRTGRPGSGLGLALSREIVEAHGGRIEVESQLGQGSSFTIWLPANS